MEYKVIVYTNHIEMEEGLNKMTEAGYTYVDFERSANGYCTVIYSKTS